jgi:hypothetical protein
MTTPRLVSSLEKYLNAPSTSGFIELLSAIRDKEFSITEGIEDQLDRVTMASHAATSTSIFEFDRALWSILPSIDLDICWGMIYDRRNKKGDFSEEVDKDTTDRTVPTKPLPPTIDERMQQLVGDAISSQHALERALQAAREETGNALVFFAEVNQLISKTDSFAAFVDRSRELERLLISLCESDGAKPIERTIILNMRSWRWIAQGVASSYLSLLNSQLIDEEDNSERLIAHGMALAHSVMFFQSAHCSGFTPNVNSLRSILKISKGFSSEEGPFQPFSTLIDSFESDDDHEAFFTYSALALMVSASPVFTRDDCWKFFIARWIYNEIELEDGTHSGARGDYADEVFFLVKLLCAFAGDRGSKSSESIHSSLISNLLSKAAAVDTERFRRALRKLQLGSLPTIDLSCFLLREVRGFDRAGIDDDLNWVAECLVRKVNDEFSRSGLPPAIPFVQSISQTFEGHGFILKRAAFYDSLSTIAINLGEREWDTEHFDRDSSSRCYLAATKRIAESGYREYAAVFLAYALMRATMIIPEMVDRWSVRELDETVRRFIGATFIERYIAPCLRVIREYQSASIRNQFGDSQFYAWSESVLSEFSRTAAPVLQLVRGPQSDASEIVPPVWFFGGSDSLLQALSQLRAALSEASPSQKQWVLLMSQYHVQESAGELLRQLEAQLVLFFVDTHNAFYGEKDLRASYFAVAPPNHALSRQGENPNVGWIERFLRGIACADDGRETLRLLQKLRLIANETVSGLGDMLSRIHGQVDLVNSLGDARILDNTTSHNLPIKPHDRIVNARGVVRKKQLTRAQVLWVYNYVTVDFGLLFEILHPMISDSSSDDTD